MNSQFNYMLVSEWPNSNYNGTKEQYQANTFSNDLNVLLPSMISRATHYKSETGNAISNLSERIYIRDLFKDADVLSLTQLKDTEYPPGVYLSGAPDVIDSLKRPTDKKSIVYGPEEAIRLVGYQMDGNNNTIIETQDSIGKKLISRSTSAASKSPEGNYRIELVEYGRLPDLTRLTTYNYTNLKSAMQDIFLVNFYDIDPAINGAAGKSTWLFSADVVNRDHLLLCCLEYKLPQDQNRRIGDVYFRFPFGIDKVQPNVDYDLTKLQQRKEYRAIQVGNYNPSGTAIIPVKEFSDMQQNIRCIKQRALYRKHGGDYSRTILPPGPFGKSI